MFGGFVEAAALKIGLPYVKFTQAQISQWTRIGFVRVSSSVFGVVLGCTLAMTQMLFMDLEKAEKILREFLAKTIQ